MILRRLSEALTVLVVTGSTLDVPPFVQDAAADGRTEYSVVTSIPLERAPSGTGRLELLEDSRIRPEVRPEVQVTPAGIDCPGTGSDGLRALCASLVGNPLRPALVRVVTSSGQELGTQELERPLADLSVVRLYGGQRPTYAIMVDFSAGFGSYSGPITRLAEVHRGRLAWLRAYDARTRRVDEIRLPATLKTAWQFSPQRGRPTQDILLVACRPVLPASADQQVSFDIRYVRFSFEGARWRRYERTEPGFWESDSPFPGRSKFP